MNFLKVSLIASALMLSASSTAHATVRRTPKPAPEVDPSLAVSGLILLGGSLTVLTGRRKKQ